MRSVYYEEFIFKAHPVAPENDEQVRFDTVDERKDYSELAEMNSDLSFCGQILPFCFC